MGDPAGVAVDIPRERLPIDRLQERPPHGEPIEGGSAQVRLEEEERRRGANVHRLRLLLPHRQGLLHGDGVGDGHVDLTVQESAHQVLGRIADLLHTTDRRLRPDEVGVGLGHHALAGGHLDQVVGPERGRDRVAEPVEHRVPTLHLEELTQTMVGHHRRSLEGVREAPVPGHHQGLRVRRLHLGHVLVLPEPEGEGEVLAGDRLAVGEGDTVAKLPDHLEGSVGREAEHLVVDAGAADDVDRLVGPVVVDVLEEMPERPPVDGPRERALDARAPDAQHVPIGARHGDLGQRVGLP